MHRFYVNLPLNDSSTVELPAPVVQHFYALRLKYGTEIELFNGNGNAYIATLVELNKKSATAKITNNLNVCVTNGLDIRLAISIIANDKMGLIMQKATELGVSQITPIISSRTQQKNSERMEKRVLHWQNTITSSCEQCGLNVIPKLNTIQSFDTFIIDNGKNTNSMNIILSPYASDNSTSNLTNYTADYITLVVGPEGGFENKEIELAIKNKFTPLTLGSLVMRAETAVIASIAAMHTKFGKWLR